VVIFALLLMVILAFALGALLVATLDDHPHINWRVTGSVIALIVVLIAFMGAIVVRALP